MDSIYAVRPPEPDRAHGARLGTQDREEAGSLAACRRGSRHVRLCLAVVERSMGRRNVASAPSAGFWTGPSRLRVQNGQRPRDATKAVSSALERAPLARLFSTDAGVRLGG
jgi:hypothetical protein